MKVFVVVEHESCYPNPISFCKGDRLRIGEEDSDYPGWIRVTTSDGNEGWAPKEYLAPEAGNSNYSIAKVPYSAFELTTQMGDELFVIKELNGWLWVKNISGICGWVPANSVSK